MKLDALALCFKAVRDATVCNEDVTFSEAISVLAVVQDELLNQFKDKMMEMAELPDCETCPLQNRCPEIVHFNSSMCQLLYQTNPLEDP